MGLQIKGFSICGFCIRPAPEYPINVDYLVVAGGGGGGALLSATNTVGNNSCFFGICTTGGGISRESPSISYIPGGSGGGGIAPSAGAWFPGGSGNCPPTSPPQGCPGGCSYSDGVGRATYGGGGGAGQNGGSEPTLCWGGFGGNGCISCITGQCLYYAGGGGGGVNRGDSGPGGSNDGSCMSRGGLGGGGIGRGGVISGPTGCPAYSGNVNTGGGGGGSAFTAGGGAGGLLMGTRTIDSSNVGSALCVIVGAGGIGGTAGSNPHCAGPGGAGGSGIVVVRYPGPQRALGGNTYACGGNTIHIFRTSGNLCFLTDFVAPPEYPFPVNYLVVAGGGGTGTWGDAGGGGAGGLLYGTTSLSLSPSGGPCCFCIVVGAGGAVSVNSPGCVGCSGSNSCLGSLIITHGGGGGAGSDSPSGGIPGGSGGGAGGGAYNCPAQTGSFGSGNTPPTSPAQGCPGAKVTVFPISTPGYPYGGQQAYGTGAGGGGAGESGFGCYIGGGCQHANLLLKGGNGCYLAISGTPAWYAGGGGGGFRSLGPSCNPTGQYISPGGCGGGGRGGIDGGFGFSGNVNTGGGGGGGAGGSGGSGIVIVSYAGSQRAEGGNVTCVAGNTIHTFTVSGNLCFFPYYVIP